MPISRGSPPVAMDGCGGPRDREPSVSGTGSSGLLRALRVAILALVCALALCVRLFAVVRYESVIHEFDPYFNYRSTQFLAVKPPPNRFVSHVREAKHKLRARRRAKLRGLAASKNADASDGAKETIRSRLIKTDDSLGSGGRVGSLPRLPVVVSSLTGQEPPHIKTDANEPVAINMVPAAGRTHFTLGGNLWPSNLMPHAVRQTGMKLLRLWIDTGLSGADSPVNLTIAEADAWANSTVVANGKLARFQAFAADASRDGVQLLLGGGGFGSPYMLPGKNNVFDPARVQDAALMWAAIVHRMAAPDCFGHTPAFIELSNEPNGHWNTFIAPATWAKLACSVRAALDARGLTSVGISGPGVSLGSSERFLVALEATGSLKKCVSLLSVHTWEDTATRQGPHEMAALLETYQKLRSKFDPAHTKLWVATEYGSRTNWIAGTAFNHSVNKCYETKYTQKTLPSDAEVLSPKYGARVAAFTLLHMNTEFDSVLYWWVQDYGVFPPPAAATAGPPPALPPVSHEDPGLSQRLRRLAILVGWSPLCFGLTSRNGTATAPLESLLAMFTVPGLALPTLRPVERSWTDDDTVTAAAVAQDGRGAVLWVVHAPSDGTGALHRSYTLTGLHTGATVNGSTCYPTVSSCAVTHKVSANDDARAGVIIVTVSLAPNSAVAISVGTDTESSGRRLEAAPEHRAPPEIDMSSIFAPAYLSFQNLSYGNLPPTSSTSTGALAFDRATSTFAYQNRTVTDDGRMVPPPLSDASEWIDCSSQTEQILNLVDQSCTNKSIPPDINGMRLTHAQCEAYAASLFSPLAFGNLSSEFCKSSHSGKACELYANASFISGVAVDGRSAELWGTTFSEQISPEQRTTARYEFTVDRKAKLLLSWTTTAVNTVTRAGITTVLNSSIGNVFGGITSPAPRGATRMPVFAAHCHVSPQTIPGAPSQRRTPPSKTDDNGAVAAGHSLPPIEPRVQALLARMTPEAKVAQLMIGRGPKPGTGNWPDGFGCTQGMSFSRPKQEGDAWPSHAEQISANDALQKWALENTTYGIPLSFYAETLHTAQNGATIFPAPVGLGATWNLELIKRAAETIGYEARLKGIDRAWSPELQVATDPRFGRFDEAFSEDPHLVAHLGVAFATGLQGGATGGPDTYGNFSATLTEAKHFAAYGQSGMDGLSSDISNATLFNVYLRPWRAFAKKAGGRGLMASHQALNGVPNHANRWLLTEVWRGKFGANHSFVGSDQDDVTRLMINGRGVGYGVAPDCLHAGAMALNAGVDSALGYSCFQNLTQALALGLVDMATLDRAAGNVLRAKFAAGLFDGHAFSDPAAVSKIRSPAAQQLAYDTAVESVTLVQNNDTLPLKLGVGGVRRVAVVGPNAGCVGNAASCDYGGYDPIVAQQGPYVWSSGHNTVSVLEAVSKSAGADGPLSDVSFSQGAFWGSSNDSLQASAVAAAKDADVVIAVVGDTDAAYGHGTCAEGIDADTLDLPGGQLALLDALARTGTPVIAILINGRPATFGAGPSAMTGPNNALLGRLAAVLVAWRTGEAGGTAIWDLITGAQNPSGHLTQNWLRSVGAVRGPSSPWFQLRRPGLPFHYVSEPATPLWSFGFGLSFSKFTFGPTLQLSALAVTAADTFTAHLNVSSAGPAGKAVVQVYASDRPVNGVVGYQYTLLCFAKVDIPEDSPGVVAAILCDAADLDTSYDTNSGQYVVHAGMYTLIAAQHAGELPMGSSAQLRVK